MSRTPKAESRAAESPARASFVSGRPADLRDFIQLLDKAGHLLRVTEPVDWKFEIGARSRATNRPLLFENVIDYPGSRVFTNGLCDSRALALALGRDADVPQATLLEEAKPFFAAPPPPVLMGNGPALENVIEGNNLDLFSFPVPQWNPCETARYIGTWHLNVSRDPETRARNVGVYRMQLLGSKRATVSASPQSDFACHARKAEAQGQPLPMAVAIGVPEVAVMAAGAACPAGMDEYELAGALQGRPVELIRCPTLDLEVPAMAEIVIEGFIEPGARALDGPYFDYCGRPNSNPQAYIFEATRLTYRSQPIFRGAAIGRPGAEDHQLFAFLAQLGLVDFHGSRKRQKTQNFLWKHRAFRALQAVGRFGSTLRTFST